jgi:uncharacterized membrane protein
MFSFAGWIIDSLYRSFVDRKWTNAGYFSGPFCPIYGVGGLLLVFAFQAMEEYHPAATLIVSSLGLVLVEYLGGIFSERILKVRLWDYSKTTFNVGGHIDILHSFYWLLLASGVYFLAYPSVKVFESLIDDLGISAFLDIPLMIIFFMVMLILVIRRDPSQFLEWKGRVINMSVEDYKVLFADHRKMLRVKSGQVRSQLQDKIRNELENTGAKLRDIHNSWVKFKNEPKRPEFI